ncbi:hypothetical protein JAAARDRAFT_61528 [Jaapia argillacea MUCL 33604]|uniref:Restriction of telomere capping protein 4 C-terminal domain-containing protein n=1 Tax=Jaapia argillacea MUCL 33604 TaxID=933084 RepID=A0A067PDI6_9AGAM|nr:hypothetical protein JAAARDRAFT_61528 [Jaapia argillacea MUCL 33604]
MDPNPNLDPRLHENETYPPDPQLNFKLRCRKEHCNQPMGGFRVYLGKSNPGRAHLRGAIVQTCTSCYYTLFHTDSYIFSDAEAFVRRLNLRQTGIPCLSGPLRLAPPGPPPPDRATTKVYCSKLDCFVKGPGGQRTTANVKCIEKKCKKCCEAAHLLAQEMGRAACKTHKLLEIQPRIAPSSPHHRESPQPSLETSHRVTTTSSPLSAQPPPSPLFPSDFQGRSGPPQPHIPNLAVSHSSRGPATPRASQPTPSSSQRPPRRNALAQPLDPMWSQVHHQARQERDAKESLKRRREDIDAEKKRTVEIHFYHTNGCPPVSFTYPLPTYPDLILSRIPHVMNDFKLSDISLVDVYIDTWKTITITTSFPVDCSRPVFVRLRPSLLEELKDCPGLAERVAGLPKRNTLNKRALDTVVSPPKKVARRDNSTPIRPKVKLEDIIYIDTTPPPSHPPSLPSNNPSVTIVPHPRSIPPSQPQGLATSKQRRFPSEYFVKEIFRGLSKLEELRAPDEGANQMTLEKAWQLAFPTVGYVQSTAKALRATWKKASPELINRFCRYGHSPKGLYQIFKGVVSGTVASNDTDDEMDSWLAERGLSPLSNVLPMPEEARATARSIKAFVVDERQSPVDQSMRCEYCDYKWPPGYVLSEEMDLIRGKLVLKTKLNCRDTFEYCAQHKYECELLPQARQLGWPESVDFSNLDVWILAKRGVLEVTLKNITTNEFFMESTWRADRDGKSGEDESRKGPEESSQEDSESEKDGDDVRVSARGPKDFYAVSKRSAGYYGAEGFMMIRYMFPDHSFDLQATRPLSWDRVICEVFLPEVTVRLIQEDLGIDCSLAIWTQEESAAYGLHHFSAEESESITRTQKWIIASTQTEEDELQFRQVHVGNHVYYCEDGLLDS